MIAQPKRSTPGDPCIHSCLAPDGLGLGRGGKVRGTVVNRDFVGDTVGSYGRYGYLNDNGRKSTVSGRPSVSNGAVFGVD